MQNYSKNFVARTLAWILAVVMVVSMVPMNVFAEVAPANWVDDNKEARYWPIPHQAILRKVSSADPVKNPSLRFIGGYTRPDGREVVRIAFSAYTASATGVWDRLLIKPDSVLNNKIDWDLSGMGKGKPGTLSNATRGVHDWYGFNEEFVKFSDGSASQLGSGNIHVMDLTNDGTGTTKTGALGAQGFEAPIDLVLKAGESIRDLTENPLIQMRLMDSEYKLIYSTALSEETQVPYSTYTMSTFIPVRKNLTPGILMNDVIRNHENIYQSAASYIKYDEERGILDVFTRRTHGAVDGKKLNNGGSANYSLNDGVYGFRQTFDKSFLEILKAQDKSGTVAQVFLGNDKDEAQYPINKKSPKDPDVANRIDLSIDKIKTEGDLGILQVADNDWPKNSIFDVTNTTTIPQKTFVNDSVTLTGYGDSTIVRYFIDKNELKKKFGNTDLVAYEFFSSLIASNKDGVEQYKSPVRDEDIDLKRGDIIRLRFDNRRDLITAGTFDVQGSYIQIGDDQFAIDIRTSKEKASYTGSPGKDYMRVMDVKVPFDIKIKKYTPLTVYSRKTSSMQISGGMKVTFERTIDRNSTRQPKKWEYYFTRPLAEGYTRHENGDIYKGNQQINVLKQDMFVDTYEPLVISRQENYGGGILTKTVDVPDVDETFTDTKFLSGRSKYDRVNVYVYTGKHTITDGEGNKKDFVKAEDRIATIKASDQKVKMNVNGDDVEGFQWASNEKFDETEGADNSAYVNPTRWAKKDTGIYFTNQDVLQNALENDIPVIEQIQAKVAFDLNGGKLPRNVVSYQGIDSSKLLGTEFAYDLNRNSETEKVTRIAPLNNNIRGEASYKESGFAGDNVNYKDHNGNDLAGDALELRKMPATDALVSPDPELEFLGWTTQKMPGDATEEYTKLTEATTVDQVYSDQNYIFTDKTPFDSQLTVYAAYGKPLVKLVLHRNMSETDTVTEEIILKDTDFNSGKTINIPRMYYNTNSLQNGDFIESFNKDNFQEDFLKRNTFVGWMLPNQENNGYKEEKTYPAGALLENNGYTAQEMNDKAINLTDLSATKALPNTFGLKLDKTYAEAKNDGPIHLYASYRPFYTVKMKKQFKKSTDNGYEDLTSEEAQQKMHDVKFGLLYRTAVTNWNDPTVLQAANYFILNKDNLLDQEILKTWKKDEQNIVSWSVPGYDILGQRISYIGVEVPIGEEKTYAEHKGADDWSTLGINVYMRIPEDGGNAIQDEDAPFDPINELVRLSKSQSVSIKRPGSKDVDAFTAATSRKPLGVDTAAQGKKDSKLGPTEIAQITGYEITVTNIPVDVETPKFKGNIYDGEKTITIYKPKDDAINKLKVTFARNGQPTYEQEFTKKPNEVDAWTSATPGGKPAFEIVKDSDGDYVIQLKNKTYKFKTDDVITAQFLKNDAPSKVATNVVQAKVDANKITDIEQVPFDRDRTEEPDKVKIKVKIPKPVTGAPGTGSKFTPGIIDENGDFKSLEGVDPIVLGDHLQAGENVTLEIPKTSIKHGDKIYFKSEEGRSKYDVTPGKNADKDGFGHVEIDLEGPVIKDALLKDDYFRLYADLSATLSGISEDNAVKIIIGDREQTFRTKSEAIEYFRAVVRQAKAEDMPKVKIVAFDEFNNKTEVEVEYEREEIIESWVNYFAIGDDKLNVKSNAGATIKIEIKNRGNLVASATVDSATGEYEDANLITAGSTEPYKLKRGDIIFIDAFKGKARANKLVRFVR